VTAITVIEPGLQTTVQDLGRFGHAAVGVVESGAADGLSLRAGNRLLGNADGAAGLEMALVGAAVRFDGDAAVALAGARVEATVDGRAVAMWAPIAVRAGETLRVGPVLGGARVYLCVGGGVRTQRVMGSRATHVMSGVGGAALRAGDGVAIGQRSAEFQVPSSECAWIADAIGRRMLRVTRGTHSGLFGEAALEAFAGVEWRVSDRSDRVGVRLEGAAVAVRERGELASEGVPCGAVQVTPSGGPIVLLHDRPVTGGYPVIACVIGADLCALGQLRARETVRFEFVEVEEAHALLREQEALLDRIGPARRVGLNVDLGEGLGLEHDERLMRSATQVNIACGGHAGDEASVRETVRAAKRNGCAVGAHPSYPDRAGFGRVEMAMEAGALVESVAEQVGLVARVCSDEGVAMGHVKPHGALYHACAFREEIARAVAEGARRVDAGAGLMGLAGSPGLDVWRGMGMRVIAEGFADRVYEADGSLRSRKQDGAMITRVSDAVEQALAIAVDGVVKAESLCVHSDTEGAAELARAVRAALECAKVM